MKWTTKDGTEIDVSDMSDSHLLNAHRVMCRRLIDFININHRKQYADDDEPAPIGIGYHDSKASRAMDIERRLRAVIAERNLIPLVETPEDEYLTEIQQDGDDDMGHALFGAEWSE